VSTAAPRYVYIMGRGHSGSTILDIVLGSGVGAASVGEVVSGLGREDPNEPCACGRPVSECPFWNKVRRRFLDHGHHWRALGRASRQWTDVLRWPRLLLASRGNPELCRLAEGTRVFARSVTEVSGKPNVVDSNKDVARALFLLKFLPEARVIHLVRDPRDVLRSHHWRLVSGKPFVFLRRRIDAGRWAPLLLLLAAASWTVGNLLAELTTLVAPDRVVRLRYEDLRRDPAAVVRAIRDALSIPLEDVARALDRGGDFLPGHGLGGNHIRFAGLVRFDRRSDDPKPLLPLWAEWATVLLCWPLMLRYGYLAPGLVPTRAKEQAS
jgi:hypothetical protein